MSGTSAAPSAFEILGPIMVGPSSSHTAGALRLAQVAASLMEAPVARVRFVLHNSFAHTYRGHGTDRALVAGILGLATDDERIRGAFDLAAARGLSFEFVQGADDSHLHPNTVDIEMTDDTGASRSVRGESLGGGRIRLSRINGVSVKITGEYDTVFVAHRDARGVLAALTVLLSTYGLNIAFMRTYRTERGGAAYTVFELDDLPRGSQLEALLQALRGHEHVEVATLIRMPGTTRTPDGSELASDFSDARELLALCEQAATSIGAIARAREEELSGADAAKKAMERVIAAMRAETTEPLEHPARSLGGLIGGEAAFVHQSASRLAEGLMGAVQTDAVARAMAVLERSASMGVIVAAPTAGSAGIVPGSVLAAGEHLGADDGAIADALYCAAAVGLILTLNASVSGAEGGCQAEVGSASAMAAAALVQLFGGTPRQALDAASLALANLLGLVCDPVGGLVEVPCQVRNAIGVADAFSAAQLALSGVSPLVPFDEMATVMRDVGSALPATLRETAKGGIAKAPSACSACAACTSR
ncbi:L-serine ammonia-lyase, iron-sulfur-dependent, subunit alpha [Enorma sp.]|uniref:L-serine ammonia-lyase, iron-sulfur-dependent, subunit alpha n=1 Tax=Enorma sp. TaxID=1920692 RepID=UPI003AB60F22